MSFLRSGGELCFPHHISNPQQPQVDTDYTDIAIRYLVRLRNVGCLLHIFHSAPGWWLVVVEAVFIKSGGCEGDEEMILCSHQSHQGPVITCLAWKQGHSAADSHQQIIFLSFVSVDIDKKRVNKHQLCLFKVHWTSTLGKAQSDLNTWTGVF